VPKSGIDLTFSEIRRIFWKNAEEEKVKKISILLVILAIFFATACASTSAKNLSCSYQEPRDELYASPIQKLTNRDGLGVDALNGFPLLLGGSLVADTIRKKFNDKGK
jgi:hypothetical protein